MNEVSMILNNPPQEEAHKQHKGVNSRLNWHNQKRRKFWFR